MQFLTGGIARELVNSVDLVKFQGRQLKSGWEKIILNLLSESSHAPRKFRGLFYFYRIPEEIITWRDFYVHIKKGRF